MTARGHFSEVVIFIKDVGSWGKSRQAHER